MAKAPTMEVENIASPGSTYRVDAAKYNAVKDAMLARLPKVPPGMPAADIRAAITPLLPQELFPGGDKVGWWVKCVHLDLEAKAVLARTPKPVRLYRI